MNNKEKKVGILTFHKANNYGATLQAYALSNYLLSQGINCEIIENNDMYIQNKYRAFQFNTQSAKKFIFSIIVTFLQLPYKITKNRRFNKFRTDFLKRSANFKNLESKIKEYEYLICGSDQIWNLKLTNQNLAYFFEGSNDTQIKIAYGASVGDDISDFSSRLTPKILSLLAKFNYISSREMFLSEYLNKILTRHDIANVMDPVFLLTNDDWNRISSKVISDDYLLIYTLTKNDVLFDYGYKIANYLNLKIYIISDTIRRNEKNLRYLKNIGPVEFITYFKNANFILTDSFHGTAFSIIFKIPFYSLARSKIGRIGNLLTKTNLSSRLIMFEEESKELSFDLEHHNFDVTNMHVKASKDYLAECLKDVML